MTLYGPGSDRRGRPDFANGDPAAAIDGDAAAERRRRQTAPPSPNATPPTAPPPPTQPDWRPPPHDSGRNASLIFGVIILVVGLWFFATRTLGLDLPRLDWGQLWPIVLIAIGGLIVLNAMRHRTR